MFRGLGLMEHVDTERIMEMNWDSTVSLLFLLQSDKVPRSPAAVPDLSSCAAITQYYTSANLMNATDIISEHNGTALVKDQNSSLR